MSKNSDTIYGSTLTRKDLEPLLPKNQKIPFVYIYACALKADLSQDEIFDKITSYQKHIPDFKKVTNSNSGTEYDSVFIEFTQRQWSIQFRLKNQEIWIDMAFGEHGKEWGSNYALWILHLDWIKKELGATFVRDHMDHVHPADIKLPKN